MPFFVYKARNRQGQVLQGELEGESRAHVARRLISQNYIPSSIQEKKEEFSINTFEFSDIFDSISIDDKIMFASQMSTLLRAGIPLISCFDGLIEQASSKKFRNVLTDVKERVEEGSPLNEAMRAYPKVFEDVFISMVMAGELSGNLDQTLERLTQILEKQYETKKKISEVTRYPKIVVGSLTVAVVVLMLFVVPNFINIFAKAKIELPMPTQILIALNYGFQNYWYIILAVVGISVFMFKQFIKTEHGRYQYDAYILRAPIFGDILLKVAMAQFSVVLSGLIKSGVPIMQALSAAGRTAGNVYITDIIDEIVNDVREGSGLAGPIKNHSIFPPLVSQMVAAGEASGALDEMLLKVAIYFDEQADRKIKNLSSLIEPIMMAALAGIVLFLAMAIFLPMWDMTKMAG